MPDEREPNIEEDARKQEQSTEGYPETDPSASGDGTTDEDGGRPTNNPSGGHRDSPPSKATGNPDAAGP